DLLYGAVDGSAFVALGNGDGTFGTFQSLQIPGFGIAVARIDGDGYPDVVGVNSLSTVAIAFNRGGSSAVQARAFEFPSNRILGGGAGDATICLRLEPVAGTYVNSNVDLNSIVLSSTGTGSVSEIAATTGKTVIEDDTDRNGVGELGACFAKSDFA